MRARAAAGPVLVALAFAAIVVACAPPPQPSPPRPLRIALNSGPVTLDPHRGELSSLAVLRNVYDALTAFDAGIRVGPALAESWENPDDLTWIFHLRRGVRFHSGRPLTASDVVFSLGRARGAGSTVSSFLVAIDKVSAIDEQTVQITTLRPYPILLNKLAFVLIAPADSPARIEAPIGTGPYRVLRARPERSLVLDSFVDHWGGAPPEAQVELLFLPDATARVAGLLAGDYDIAEAPSRVSLGRIRAASACRVVERQGLGVSYLAVRPSSPPFSDARLRHAIAAALDRPRLAAEVWQGLAQPIGQMATRDVFGFIGDLEPPAADLDAARRLLREAGHPEGLDTELQIDPKDRLAGEALARQLGAIGVRVRLRERPLADFAGDVALSFASWYSLSGDASDFLDALAHSPDAQGYGAGNFVDYRNPSLDRLIDESGATLDVRRRRTLLEQAMRALIADDVFVPLYSDPELYGVRADIVWQPRSDEILLASTVRRRTAQ